MFGKSDDQNRTDRNLGRALGQVDMANAGMKIGKERIEKIIEEISPKLESKTLTSDEAKTALARINVNLTGAYRVVPYEVAQLMNQLKEIMNEPSIEA